MCAFSEFLILQANSSIRSITSNANWQDIVQITKIESFTHLFVGVLIQVMKNS